jgi:hypothetical protein
VRTVRRLSGSCPVIVPAPPGVNMEIRQSADCPISLYRSYNRYYRTARDARIYIFGVRNTKIYGRNVHLLIQFRSTFLALYVHLLCCTQTLLTCQVHASYITALVFFIHYPSPPLPLATCNSSIQHSSIIRTNPHHLYEIII